MLTIDGEIISILLISIQLEPECVVLTGYAFERVGKSRFFMVDKM